MLINSIYSTKDEAIALSQFEIAEDDRIILCKLWRSDSKTVRLFPLLTQPEVEQNLFNGVEVGGEARSLCATKYKAFGVQKVKVAESLSYAEALEMYKILRAEYRFETKGCRGWKQLNERLFVRNAGTGSPDEMSFLQGAIAAAERVRKGKRATMAHFTTHRPSRTVAESMGYSEPRGLYPF